MRPSRICAICGAKIRDKQRLCIDHINQYKHQLVNDKGIFRVGPLTEDWLRGIINYAEYEHNVTLRDYGRVVPIEKVKI